MAKKADYTFLLQNYSKISEYLSSDTPAKEDFPDIVISFCTVVEKILKIKLHKKNPILVFDLGVIKDANTLARISLRKEETVITARIDEIVRRFRLIFPKDFSEDKEQALLEIYQIRNRFIHDYKPTNKISFDQEDLVKKMGTIWEEVSDLAIKLFGKQEIKRSIPKKKYSEQELEQVLENEVQEMIRPVHVIGTGFGVLRSATAARASFSPTFSSFGEQCPRCDKYTLSLGTNKNSLWAGGIGGSMATYVFPQNNSSLYKCESCNLELTSKQYAMAKRIRGI